MDFLKIINISVILKNFQLKDISLTLPKGKALVILGPSGSGKSMLLETLAGFYKPAKGEVWLNERNITDLPPEERRIGFMFQDYALFPHKTVRQNIEFPLKFKKSDHKSDQIDINNIIDMLNIGHLINRYPVNLSGGEKQRAALARALASGSQLYLFDEPMSALDTMLREALISNMQNLFKNFDLTAVYVTHNLQEALTIGDYIAIINNGSLVQCGTQEEVFCHPSTPFAAEFVGMENMLAGQVLDFTEERCLIQIESTPGITVMSKPPNNTILRQNEKVILGIRPEDVLVETAAFSDNQYSHTNIINAKISEIVRSGILYKVVFNEPCSLISYLKKHEITQMELTPGKAVRLSISPEDIQVLRQ